MTIIVGEENGVASFQGVSKMPLLQPFLPLKNLDIGLKQVSVEVLVKIIQELTGEHSNIGMVLPVSSDQKLNGERYILKLYSGSLNKSMSTERWSDEECRLVNNRFNSNEVKVTSLSLMRCFASLRFDLSKPTVMTKRRTLVISSSFS